MKKITLFIFLLTMSIGYAQQTLVQDFETGTDGLGEPFGGAAAEIVADPAVGGTRGQVAKLTASASGEVWQGLNVNMTSNVTLTTDKTMEIDIYSNEAITIAPRVQGGLDGAPVSTAVVSHTGSGWETLTITFNTGSNNDQTANGVYSEFVIYYLWDNGFISPAIDRVFYADNIKGIVVEDEVVVVEPEDKDLVQDFETGTDGLGEPFGGAAAEIVADPAVGGTRGQVAKLTASASGEVWQGLNVNMTSNVTLTTDKTMEIDIYSNEAITIAPRVQGGLDGAPVSTAVVSHTGSGWETLTITFNTGSNNDQTANGVYSEFVIYYLWDNGFIDPAIERVFYADNIKGIVVEDEVVVVEPEDKDLVQDFETGTDGLGEPFGGAAAEIVADPAVGGTRGQVAKLTASATGEVWQGLNVNMTSNVTLTTDKTMEIDIYSNEAITIAPRVQGGLDGAPVSTAVVSHTGSGWETLTITFNTGSNNDQTANGVYSEFVIYYLWDNGFISPAIDRVFYADNIKGIAVAAPVVNTPTIAAPTPPNRNAEDVISIYSDAYTNVANNFDAGWCGPSSVEIIQVEGNNTVEYKGNACQGIVLDAAMDATAFTNLHVDVYIDATVDVTSKVFNLKFVGVPNTIFKEYPFNAGTTPALVAGSWVSIDIPVDLSTMSNFKEFGITADNLTNQVWYDNLYIYKGAPLSIDKNNLLNISVSPNPARNDLKISTQGTIDNVTIYNVLGKKLVSKIIGSSEGVINVSNLKTGIYILKYTVNSKVGTMKFVKE
ncbi:T9SS type A sorting domain-containing protein [uncultured Polaribacter sp.]|uniref:T9SS type A sorting domain-containing protein n=1 Tax=uncultured Polaribacter sp. TaxID=174711 RepID=UPI0026277EDD|nr:T9SS type A sorting domain-containing protein [uncultured Polaribacter sp.]